MRLYAGCDLHSINTYLGVIDEDGKRVFKKKLSNDREVILNTLAPYKDNMAGIVVKSTYNWYWLVDVLTEEGYKAHLANTNKIQKYSGLKYADDQHDALFLAEMLRLVFSRMDISIRKKIVRFEIYSGSEAI
jgi:transposase